MKIKRGSTSVRRLIFIADSSSTTGAGLANLTHASSGLVWYYFAGDLSNEVEVTLATMTLGTWASGGFVAVDNTNMPGWYEIGIPNAALDGGNEVAMQLRGVTNMVPVNIYIELDAVNYQSATNFGLSDVTAILGDTNELQTDWVNGGRLDNILDARASQTTADAIEVDTQDIQTRIPAALVSGRIDASVGAMANSVFTSSAMATSSRDAISQKLSEDIAGGLNNWPLAVIAMNAGLATSAALTVVDAVVDTILASLGSPFSPSVQERGYLLGALEVPPPADLGFTPPVKIYRHNGEWFTDLAIEDYKVAASVTYYLSPTGNDVNSGLNLRVPKKSLSALLTTLNATPPAGATLYLAPGLYSGADTLNGGNFTFPCNIICPDGRAILGGWSAVTWSTYNSIYQSAYTGQADVALIDMVSLDAYGHEKRYRLASSLANCEATPGTHWIAASVLYVNPFDGKDLTADQNAIAVGGNGTQLSWDQTTATEIYMEGIHFWGNWGMPTIITSDTTGVFAFNRCGFSYAVNGKNGIATDAALGNLFVCKDTIAVYNQLDGFNWDGITLGNSCTIVEVDCTANYNGFGLSNANDNGSTCHKGVKIIRVNGTYLYNHDRNIHDIESVRAWNIGCVAGPAYNADPDPYDNIAWCFGRAGNTDATQAWLWDCDVLDGSVADLGSYGNAVVRLSYGDYSDWVFDGDGAVVRVDDIQPTFTKDLESLFDPLATQESLESVEAITDKLDTMLLVDGPVWRYTTDALENAPAGGGGGSDAEAIWDYFVLNGPLDVNVLSAADTFISDLVESLRIESGADVSPISPTLVVQRLVGHTLPLNFSWTRADNTWTGAEFSVTKSINGATPQPATGSVIAAGIDTAGRRRFVLQYAGADYPAGEGTVEFGITAGGATVVVRVLVTKTITDAVLAASPVGYASGSVAGHISDIIRKGITYKHRQLARSADNKSADTVITEVT